MPHAFFIGSKMACMRRLPPSAYGDADDDRPEDDDAYYYERDKDRDAPAEETTKPRYFFMPSLHLPQPFKMSQAGFEFVSTPRIPMDEIAATTGDDDDDGCSNPVAAEQQKKKKKKKTKERQRSKPSLNCVRAHLTHACFDVAGSLLGFALVVNSAILILAAAVFYYGEGKDSSTRGEGISDLFDAYALVRQYLGQGEPSSLARHDPVGEVRFRELMFFLLFFFWYLRQRSLTSLRSRSSRRGNRRRSRSRSRGN